MSLYNAMQGELDSTSPSIGKCTFCVTWMFYRHRMFIIACLLLVHVSHSVCIGMFYS